MEVSWRVGRSDATRISALFSVNLCALEVAFSQVLERPRATLSHPEPVPKTCPQNVVATGGTHLDEGVPVRQLA
jgi:hypothetical protein